MPLNQYGLGIVFDVEDRASGPAKNVVSAINQTKDSADAMSKAFARSSKEAASGTARMFAGMKALSGMGKMVKEYAGFQSVVASAAAIAGESEKGYKKLYQAAQQAGIATMFSPRQAALGLRVLSQAGLNAQDSIKALIPTLQLATASFGELGPEQTAGLVTIAMKTFGIEASKTSLAVGQMVKAANSAKMSIGDLQMGLAGASRGSIALKQSLSETLISLGLIKNAGFGTQRASTQLAMAMARLADPKVQKKLGQLSVQVTDASGKFRPFLDVVQDVTEATADMTDKKKAAYLQDVFGMEALGGLMAITKQLTDGIKTQSGEVLRGTAAINYMRTGMANAGNTAKIMSQKYLKTMEGQFNLMAGSLKTLKIAVGAVFVKTFLPVVQMATKALNTMINLVEKLPAPIRDLVGVMAPLAASAVALGGVIKMVKGLGGMWVAAKGALALSGAAKGLAATATQAKTAVGGLGMTAAQNAAAFGVMLPTWGRTTSDGDLMLAQMRRQKVGVSKLSRAVGALGKAMNFLPIIAIGGQIGWWIGKTIASYSWLSKQNKMLKKINEELSRQIKLVQQASKATQDAIRIHRAEDEQMLRLASTITNRKTAQVAALKADKMLTDQQKRVVSAYRSSLIASEKAAATRSRSDMVAAARAKANFEREKMAFDTMAKTRERVMARLAEYTIRTTRRGTHERLQAEATMAFAALQNFEEIKVKMIEAKKAQILAEREGNADLIKIRQVAANKAVDQYEKAHKRASDLLRRAKGTAIALGMAPEEARKRVRLEVEARKAGVTRRGLALREELAGVRVARPAPEAGPAAFAPFRAAMEVVRTAMQQQAKAQTLTTQAIKRLGLPVHVHVNVGDRTITKVVDRTKTSDKEKGGGVTVRKTGTAAS